MQQYFLASVLPWTILISWCVLVICSIFYLPKLWQQLRHLPNLVIFLIIVIQIIAFIIRFTWVPDDHRIYFDEDRYLSYAVTFARFGKTVSVDLATPQESIIGIPDDAGRVTVPILNAITMRLFGFHEKSLFNTARVIHSLTVLGVFILGRLLFKSNFVGLLAALAMALLPTPVFFSPSFGLDAYFLDLAVWVLVATILAAKKPTIRHVLFFSCTLILFLCVRIEAYFFLPVIFWAYVHFREKQTISILTKIILCILGIFILLRGVASLSVFTKPWCCAEALPLESFSLTYITRHLLPNIFSLFNRPEFPWSITVFAVYALFAFTDPVIRLMGLWILIYFFVYSSYYAGLFFNPEFSGSYGRYLLVIIPPLLFLAGKTIETVWQQRKSLLLILLLIISVSIFPTIKRYPKMITYSPWDALAENGPRIIHQFLTEEILAKTPPDAIIIHNLTAPILLAGKTAVFTGSFLEEKTAQDFVTTALKKGQKVYMLPNYRCLLYPDSCEDLFKLFATKTILKKDFGGGAVLELQQLSLR